VAGNTGTALPGAKLSLLDPGRERLSFPTGTSDGNGNFDLPKTSNFHLFAHIAAHGMAGFPPGLQAEYLMVAFPGYRSASIDLQAVAQRTGQWPLDLDVMPLGTVRLTPDNHSRSSHVEKLRGQR